MPSTSLWLQLLRGLELGGPLNAALYAERFAAVHGFTPGVIQATLRDLGDLGLVRGAHSGGEIEIARSGVQYLRYGGEVSPDILRFLPNLVDDLITREAIFFGVAASAHTLLDAVLIGEGALHLRDRLFHPGWGDLATGWLAHRFIASSGMLSACLVAQRSPGTVAEEILLVDAMRGASALLGAALEIGAITGSDEMAARIAMSDVRPVLGYGRIADFLGAHFAGVTPSYEVTADEVDGKWFTPLPSIQVTPGANDPVTPSGGTIFIHRITRIGGDTPY